MTARPYTVDDVREAVTFLINSQPVKEWSDARLAHLAVLKAFVQACEDMKDSHEPAQVGTIRWLEEKEARQ